jgi:hypothetical protein
VPSGFQHAVVVVVITVIFRPIGPPGVGAEYTGASGFEINHSKETMRVTQSGGTRNIRRLGRAVQVSREIPILFLISLFLLNAETIWKSLGH